MRTRGQEPPPASNHSATWQGVAAIVIWSSLATLTTLSGPLPPLQMTAMSFVIATCVGLVYGLMNGSCLRAMFVMPVPAFLLGVIGLLGYHAAYFYALKTAPPLEASIISYLWPLLIVIFSAFLPLERGGGHFSWRVAIGALLSAAGAAIALLGNSSALTLSGSLSGYAAALAAAIIWATYSVGTRLLPHVPTSAMTGICAMTAAGAGFLHLATETTRWPLAPSESLVILLAGLGPVGLAFYWWDTGMKHGDIRLLAVLSYMTPILSTMTLAVFGIGRLTPAVAVATLLVTVGAIVATSNGTRMTGRFKVKRPG